MQGTDVLFGSSSKLLEDEPWFTAQSSEGIAATMRLRVLEEVAVGAVVLVNTVSGISMVTFPFEDIQLTTSAIGNFSAVGFGNTTSAQPLTKIAECRAFPGDKSWPTEAEWSSLNLTLGGALLKPVPVSSVCYGGPGHDASRCNYLVGAAGRSHFYLDDPLTVLSPWTEGGTCVAALNARGSCTQGGYPVYVVNATTAKHVQAAVNFARNKNLRLVIK